MKKTITIDIIPIYVGGIMDDSKKIEIFDKCINNKLQDYIDQLDDNKLDNLCYNLNNTVSNNSVLIKMKIKTLSKSKKI